MAFPNHAAPLHPLQAFGYGYASQLLAKLSRQGILDASRIQSVCDFGTGTGGPALAMQDFFQLPAQKLSLLESHAAQVESLRQLFPQSNVYYGDGITWLSRTHRQYDLMSAFMLGPDYENEGLVSEFVRLALPRLTTHGLLLICSDVATMHGVKVCLENTAGIDCHWLVMDDGAECLPVTVAVKKSAANLPISLSMETVRLPSPCIKRAWVPDWRGEFAMEHYCLSTAFEKAYLKATIESFEFVRPEHPAIAHMKAVLSDADCETAVESPGMAETYIEL